MDYYILYQAIINKAKAENRIKNKEIYYENHHIFPKCLGGNNNKENLVLLTAKEHFICHKLLTYIHKGNRKIALAFYRMSYSKNGNYNKSSRDFKYAIELLKTIPVSKETCKKISKANKGKDTWNKGKICPQLSTMKGKHQSIQTKRKISEFNKGRKHSEESKKKMSKNFKGRISPTKNLIWMHFSDNTKMIKEEEKINYLLMGWIIGRK